MPRIALAHPIAGAPVLPPGIVNEHRPALIVETPRLVLRAREPGDIDVLDVTILVKPGLAEAGWLRFSLRPGRDREVELGFFLEPAHRGRGLMREAARVATPRALRLLGARGLCALLPADALAAERVVRALGLVAATRRGSLRRFEKDLCGLI